MIIPTTMATITDLVSIATVALLGLHLSTKGSNRVAVFIACARQNERPPSAASGHNARGPKIAMPVIDPKYLNDGNRIAVEPHVAV